jgi:molecular chaperone DnaK (HSP70)
MEARAEHPGGRGLTDPSRAPIVGIDLGTTNSALAWADPRGSVRLFDILQLVASGETGRRATLPSFLYYAEESQRQSGAVRLPWNTAPDYVAGVFARDEGALVPARQIASTKSWLSNARVDRTAALLPWGADGGPKLSPVEASSRILAHLRDAWNQDRAAAGDELRLQDVPVVLTVPASFDEEARELTVQAAREAGLGHVSKVG